GEERLLPAVAGGDHLEAEVARGTEEVAVRDGDRSDRGDWVVRAGNAGGETGRAGDGEVFPFLDGDGHVALRERGPRLLRLHLDAPKDAEAIEVPLRIEDGREAEWG